VKTMLTICGGLILGLGCCLAQVAVGGEKIRILLDTDANNELDDQHAIAYLLFNGDTFAVEGITVNATSNGGGIEQHMAEATRVVQLCDLTSRIKIVPGATGKYQEILPQIEKPEYDGSAAVDFIIERALADDSRPLVLMPIGKLTNIALALKKAPQIASRVRIVWLGTNYPAPGEYNFVNDLTALDPVLQSDVAFEMVMVRYRDPTGTDAVKAQLADVRRIMPGKGPKIAKPVTGRHGGTFSNFGDYAVDLFEKFPGKPSERPLFDMAAIAIVKNPAWARRVTMGAPAFRDGKWVDRPENPRKIIIWEHFDRHRIMQDFYQRMEKYVLANSASH
jgi:purine nucleosidase